MERCKQQFAAEGSGEEVFIVDVYNAVQYPWDKQAMQVGSRGAHSMHRACWVGGAGGMQAPCGGNRLPCLSKRSACVAAGH